MPNESVNVYLSIQSGSSESVLVSLSDKTRALDKETQLLTQASNALAEANKPLMERQTQLQAKIKESQKVVNDLQKAYGECGDEMTKQSLDEAIESHAKLKSELSEVNAQIGTNQKTYKEYLETVRKGALSNPSAGIGESSGTSDLSAIWGGLGIGQQLSSLVEQAGGALLSSAFGDDMGSMMSGTLSSAITGASLGTAIAPGIGTAIGAALGGLSGLAGGAVEQWANRDAAFRDYYGGLYSDVKGRSGEMVGSGTSLASARETNRISFKTLFGSERAANEYLDDLIDMANVTPFLYDDLVSMSKTLATYGYNEKNILPLLQTIGDAGAALGMGTADMTSVAQALGRMKSSDKASLEYLNILNDRGIGAVGMLAEAKGVSQGDMYDMISKGSISGSEAVEIITTALKETYAGSMQEQSQTFAGLSSTLEGLQQNLNAIGGESYNTLRQEGVREEVNALGGELGDAIKDINRVMGENQARKENLQDQYLREALEAVLLGKEGGVFSEEENAELAELAAQYADWKSIYEESKGTDAEAAAQMESLYEQAQVLGQAYFDNSDFVKMLNDTELDEIAALQTATAGLAEATQAAYNLSQALSKGMAFTWATTSEVSGGLAGYGTESGGGGIADYGDAYVNYLDSNGVLHGHAFGLNRVPYDNYPALLHEGERVLTASEARSLDVGRKSDTSPLTVSITGNYFTGTPEEMADQLAEIILRKIRQSATAAAPK